MVNAILQRADIVLLAKFVGPTAAAVYAAAEFITRIISNARYVFDAVAAPVFSEAIHLGQNDRLLLQPAPHRPLGRDRRRPDRGHGGRAPA